MSILVLPKRQIHLPRSNARINRASPLTNKLAFAYSTTENGGVTLFDTGPKSYHLAGATLPSPAWQASGTNHFGYVPNFTNSANAFSKGSIPAPVLDTTKGYTLAAWFYRTAANTSSMRILTLDDNVNTTSFVTSLMYDAGGTNQVGVFQLAATTAGTLTTSNATTNGTNQWLFIAGTFTGSANGTLYGGTLNSFLGALAAGTNTAPVGAITNTSQRIVLGNRGDGLRPWIGQLGPVMAWGRVLSVAEIEQLCIQPGSLWSPTPANRRYWTPPASTTIDPGTSTAPGRAATTASTQVTRSLTSSSQARAMAASTLTAIRSMTSLILGKASASSALTATRSVAGPSVGKAATATAIISATKAVSGPASGKGSVTTGQGAVTRSVSGSSAGKAQTTTNISRTVAVQATVSGRGATTVIAQLTKSVSSSTNGKAQTVTTAFQVTRAVSGSASGRASSHAALAVTVVLPASVARGRSSTVSAASVKAVGAFQLRKPGGGSYLRGGDTLRYQPAAPSGTAPASIATGKASTASPAFQVTKAVSGAVVSSRASTQATVAVTVVLPPSVSRGITRITASSCTVTRAVSGQVQAHAVISQSQVSVTRLTATSAAKGRAITQSAVTVARSFTVQAAGRSYVLSSLTATKSFTSVAVGKASTLTGQLQVTKQLTGAAQARAYLTSGVTLNKFLSGLGQGRASTLSDFIIVSPVIFLPNRPDITIAEADRPIATIIARAFPQATIAARAYPAATLTESVTPVMTISERARPAATITPREYMVIALSENSTRPQTAISEPDRPQATISEVKP